MTDFKPKYESASISTHEWPYPMCEIKDKFKNSYVQIQYPEDAKAVIISLISMLNEIPFEFGGYRND